MRKAVIVFAYDDIVSKRKNLHDASADRVMAVGDITAYANDAKRALSELKH